PAHKRNQHLSNLDAWRFAEFAAAGLGAWIMLWAWLLVWSALWSGLLGGPAALTMLVFWLLAILPVGFGSVHGVFFLHDFVRKIRT
ncbi:MAG: hypothetical protein RIQ56_263, partial [Candidatus Parcubacteria bacterium]